MTMSLVVSSDAVNKTNADSTLDTILSMISDNDNNERLLGISALRLFANEYPADQSWVEGFPLMLSPLLDLIKETPNANVTEDCYQVKHFAMQAVRNLLQLHPGHMQEEDVKRIICCMLEQCKKDAPFETINTAELALLNLASGTNPEACFKDLLPYFSTDIDLNDEKDSPDVLSVIRVMRYLIPKVSPESLEVALPLMLSFFRNTIEHVSVHFRKASVFALVEMFFVLGDDLINLDTFKDCQQRLLQAYIERHSKYEAYLQLKEEKLEKVEKENKKLITSLRKKNRRKVSSSTLPAMRFVSTLM